MSLIILLLILIHASQLALGEVTFSGVYIPEKDESKPKEGSSSTGITVLMSTVRLLGSRVAKRDPKATGTHFPIIPRRPGNSYHDLVTRDFFDFMVEQLDSTSDELAMLDDQLFGVMNSRARQTAATLKRLALTPDSFHHDQRLNQTLAVLVYSSVSSAHPLSMVQSRLRKSFFEAAFWSTYRYVHHVVVVVASERDKITVENLQLPFICLEMLQVKPDDKKRTLDLPRQAFQWLHELFVGQRWRSAAAGGTLPTVPLSQFRYLFFTEADVVLHLRSSEGLFDTMDASDGNFALVPHRMQTLPLQKSMKREKLRQAFDGQQHLILATANASIATEGLETSLGSCCDHGRLVVEPCGEGRTWYQCPQWGPRDLSPWLRFGPMGFTFPTVNSHQGLCEYREQRTLCEIPEECEFRVPPRDSDGKVASMVDVCDEMPYTKRLGPNSQLLLR